MAIGEQSKDVMGPTPDERLWKASDVARFLGCSRAWVYREASAGRLPSIDLLGLRRFDPEAIRALAKRGTREPARVIPFPS
jgi:predicted DNA-binding transcriptional regulator AlpA